MRGWLFLALALPSLVGCTTQAIEDADDEAEARSIETWVVLERVDADGQVRSNVSAKFVQVTDGDRSLAFKLVGVRPAIPAAGDCVSLASLEKLELLPADNRRANGTMSADLVDAGDVTISVEGADARVIKLSPRAFPDVADFVSGVFYTSPDADTALPSAARYSLAASGSQLVEGFFVEVDAPKSPVISSVSDGPSVQAVGDPPAEAVATVGSDIHLGWEGAAVGEAGTVYVDFRGATTHRCTFADQGAAVLPAEILSAADRGEATLTLHRLVERAVQIDAADSSDEVREATVLFDFARTVRLTVR